MESTEILTRQPKSHFSSASSSSGSSENGSRIASSSARLNGSSSSSSSNSPSASIASSSSSSSDQGQHPFQPLILKCSCEERLKRIRYPDVNSLTFDAFYTRIARALQFDNTEFVITWEDDDGELCDISSDEDLSEAISFFSPNELGSSSGSGDSYQSAVSMRVLVKVDTAISLSDFGSELGGDGVSLRSGSEGSFRGDSRWNGNASGSGSSSGWSESDRRSLNNRKALPPPSTSGSNSRGNIFKTKTLSNYSSSNRGSNLNLDLDLDLDLDADLDLDKDWDDVGALRNQVAGIDTREGRSRSREDQDGSASRRRSDSSDSDDPDLPPSQKNHSSTSHTSSRSQRRGNTRRSSQSSNSDSITPGSESSKAGHSERSFSSSLPPINPFIPPPLAYTQQIATVLWNKFGQGLDPQKQPLPASWARVAQDLAEAGAAEAQRARNRVKAGAQRRVDVGATQLISQAEALGLQALKSAEYWKTWATGALESEGEGKNSAEKQLRLSSEALQRTARLREELGSRGIGVSSTSESNEGQEENPSSSWEEDLASYSRQAFADDVEGLSQLGVRSDLGLPPETSYSLGETGYAGDSFSDNGSDSGESIATVSRGSPPMGAADSINPNSRRGVERSESQTTLRAADHRALQALQQEPWTRCDINSGGSTLPERDCQCTCSKCKQKLDSDSLRYVCDICGPSRRIVSSKSNSNASNSSSSSSSSSASSPRSVLSDSTQRTSTATSDARSPSRIPRDFNGTTDRNVNERRDDTTVDLAEEWSDAVSERSNESLISESSSSSNGAVEEVEYELLGFELCFSCMHSHSRDHVDENSSSEPNASVGAPVTPVSRGQKVRKHAFFELVRKDGKWATVEDEGAKACKHCGVAGWHQGRYKCSQCDDLSLCNKCFMNVSDIHPIHVFLRMPAMVPVILSPPVPRRLLPSEVVHESVRCACCFIHSIRGPRYHCATCVGGADFCSTCEESGRAIDSNSSFGHKSSHILIKLTMPLNVSAVSSSVGNSLIRAQQRLYSEAERSHNRTRGMQISSSEPLLIRPSNRDQESIPPNEDPPAWDEDDSSSAWRQITNPNLPIPTNVGNSRILSTRDSIPNNDWYSFSRNHPVPCSACGSEILGSRFLCANCPIKERPGSQGFNLCENCEVNSLELHDPSHFFLKIRSVPNPNPNNGNGGNHSQRALALALNPFTENLRNLLPPLYKDIIPRPGIADLAQNPNNGIILSDPRESASRCFQGAVRRFVGRNNEQTIEMQRLNNGGLSDIVPLNELVHASILCDRCYEVIQGPWLRCCNCVTSFDICSHCEPNVEHDKSHVFAVFKQPVDMALFKSLVDHGDGNESGARRGASRSMLPYLIV